MSGNKKYDIYGHLIEDDTHHDLVVEISKTSMPDLIVNESERLLTTGHDDELEDEGPDL